MDKHGRFSAVVFEPESGREVASVALPERGHHVAVRPLSVGAASRPAEYLAFARQPGNFAVVFSDDPTIEPRWFTTRSDRHFHGHGVFSGDGRLLFTPENNFDAGGQGVIGVRDAADSYRQIGEFASGGVDPHEVALLADGRTMAVANGGIKTHPATPRLELNLSSMQPNLAYIDIVTGDLLERHQLPESLHQLSIRHLSVGIADTVVFGCQFKGAKWQPQGLVGRHRRGQSLECVALPTTVERDMRNYVASVAINRKGETAIIAAPRGGLAVVIDVATGNYLAHHVMDDVFGVAPHQSQDGFLLSSGKGALASTGPGPTITAHPAALAYSWDNHLARVG